MVLAWSGKGNVDLARQVLSFLELHRREDVIIVAESPVAEELKRFAESLDRGELLPDHVVCSQSGAPLEPDEFMNACFDLVPDGAVHHCVLAAQNVQQVYLKQCFARLTGRVPEFLSADLVRSDPDASPWYMRGVPHYILHASFAFLRHT